MYDTCTDCTFDPHVLVVTETHRYIDCNALCGYTTCADLQNSDLYMSEKSSGGTRGCGGVALLLRSPQLRLLHSERHKYWVIAAVADVSQNAMWIIAGLYIPPSTSAYYDSSETMAEYLALYME